MSVGDLPPAPHPRIRLFALGSVDLRGGAGAPVAEVLAQPKRLALLVVLASDPQTFHRRDLLRALFWPDLDDARARDALSQALRYLRRMLGDGILVNRGAEEIGVAPERVWCDVSAFRAAAQAGRYADAVTLYRGDLLHGFHLAGANGFDEWLERERSRLRVSAAGALRTLAEMREREGDGSAAVAAVRRAVELSGHDELAIRHLLELLDRLGDRAGALHAHEAFARGLRETFAVEPSAETQALIARIRSRAARAAPQMPTVTPPADAPIPHASPGGAGREREAPQMVSPRLRWWSVVAGSLLLVAAVTGLVSAWRRLNAAAATDHPTRRVAVVLPDTAPIAFHAATKLGSPQRALAISPDASVITYVARVRDTTMLYARRLDAAHVEPLAGTEGAHAPFFSPDSRWIAFFRGSLLARIPVNGGGAIPVAEFVEPYSGTWLSDGRIVVLEGGGTLAIVSDRGGTVHRPDPAFSSGWALADASIGDPPRWLLAHSERTLTFLSLDDSVRAYHLGTAGLFPAPQSTTPKPIAGAQLGVAPAIVGGAYLLFVQAGGDGELVAMPFDTARMAATGNNHLIRGRVRLDAGDQGVAQFAVARDGTMIHAIGGSEFLSLLVARGRDGRVDTLPVPRIDLTGWMMLSPDGHQLVAKRWTHGVGSRWAVLDLRSGVVTPLNIPYDPVIWAPDSRTLLATAERADGSRVTLRLSPQTGAVLDTVLRSGGAFAVDAHERLFLVRRWKADRDAWVVAADSSRWRPTRLTGRLGNIVFPIPSTLASLSPSGRWLTITARLGNRSEVFVAPTSSPDERVRLTYGGGEEPLWRRDETEIVFRRENSWFAVDVSTNDGLRLGRPKVLFTHPYHQFRGYSHALLPDGRLLLVQGPSGPTATRIDIVFGLGDELRRSFPVR